MNISTHLQHFFSTALKNMGLFALYSILLFGFTLHAHAGPTNSLILSDSFDTLSTGSLFGQNNWISAGGTNYNVQASTPGKIIQSGLFTTNYRQDAVFQSSLTSRDTRISMDFAPYYGGNSPDIFLRSTTTDSSMSAYMVLYFGGTIYISYLQSGVGLEHLATEVVSLTNGSWYTIEFEVVDDVNGNPELKVWVYPQNTTRPASPLVSHVDTTKKLPNAGYIGFSGYSGDLTADNVLIYSGDTLTAPGIPTNFQATPGSNHVSLSWTAPPVGGAPITDYLIQYRTGSNPFTTFTDGVSTTPSTTVIGLSPNTLYDFRVSAINSFGTSTAANVSSTTGPEVAVSIPALINHASAAGNPNIITTAINTTGATLLVATLSTYDASSLVTLTDSQSNTWHMLTDHAGTSNIHTTIWYAYNKAGGPLSTSANHTLSVSSVGSFPTVNFSAWSGTLTTGDPLDSQSGNGGNMSDISTNQITPIQNDNLIISSFGTDTSGTYTVDSPFTLLNAQDFGAADHMGNASAYVIQKDRTAVEATWHTSGGGNVAVIVAAFKAQNTSATVPNPPTTLQTTPDANQVILSWTPQSSGGAPITDYLIQYRTGSDAFATFTDGVSTTTTATVTGLTANTLYDFKVFAINSYGTGVPVTGSATTTPFIGITITSPLRQVSAAPQVATISINRNECNTLFYIPYIQTSDALSVSAVVDGSVLPSGGGVKFVLTNTLSQETVLYDMSLPFAVTFTQLAKGEYTLDTYVVNSSQVVQSGANNHDRATNIGIGDIYVAIGDSVTEGYDGTAYNVLPYTNWTQAPVKSSDNRNYPQCGISSGYYQDHWQEVSHHISLNNKLESYYGYPVFILNEGVAGITSGGYTFRVGFQTWQDRMNALAPNKWLVHLGINDGTGSSVYQNQMQFIIDTLVNDYGATGDDIVLAVPSANNGFHTYITNLITGNDLVAGPDFKTYYFNHSSDLPALYAGVHPTVPGHLQMARLWAISIMSPKGLSVTQAGLNIALSWNNLSAVEPTIAGYKVYYGNSPTNLNTVLDVGNATSTTITSGLINGQTYFFAVQGYDNDIYTPNTTARSNTSSLVYSTDTTPPTISSITATPASTTASITWTTDELASSRVEYGTTISYGTLTTETDTSPRVLSHAVNLSPLTACTLYHYRVISTDAASNTTTSADQTFTTTGCVAPPTPQPSSQPSSSTSGFYKKTPSSLAPSVPPYIFPRSLRKGTRGEDVKELQKFLNAQGFTVSLSGPGSKGNETTLFGIATHAALIKFQKANNITPSIGFFGPVTRGVVNGVVGNKK